MSIAHGDCGGSPAGMGRSAGWYRRLMPRHARLWRSAAALILALLALSSVRAEEEPEDPPPRPLMVVHVASLDRLLERVRSGFEDIERDDVAEAFDGFLSDRAGGLQGWDRSQPFGSALFLPDQLPPRPVTVLYVPVSDVEQLIATLELGPVRLERQPRDPTRDGEWYTLQLDRGGTREMVVRDGYAFLSPDDSFLEGDVATIARLAPQLGARYDAALTINVRSISPLLRDVFIAMLRSQTQAQLQRRDDEPMSQYLIRRANGQSMLELIEGTLRDGERLTLGIQAPEDSPNLILELDVEAAPDSRFADWLADLTGHPSAYASLIDDREPLTLAASWKMEPREQTLGREWIRSLEQSLTERLAPADASTGPVAAAGVHPAVQRIIDALNATVDAGRFDLCAQFRTADPGRFALIGALHVMGGETLAAGLRELLAALQASDSSLDVELDAARHGTVTLHRVRGQTLADRDRRVYGEQASLYVGASAQTLWFAFGSSRALTELKSAMDRVSESAGQPPSRQAPIQLILQTNPWLSLEADEENARRYHLADEAFDAANDGLRLEIRPRESGARVHVELEPGFARLLMLWLAERYDRSRL